MGAWWAGRREPRAGKLLGPKSFLPRRAAVPGAPIAQKAPERNRVGIVRGGGDPAARAGGDPGAGPGETPKMSNRLLTKMPPPPNCAGLAPAVSVSRDPRGPTPPNPNPL